MPENPYFEMARRGLRMPIGTDLVLHESCDPESCKYDAQLLGAVVEAAARRYRTPFAFPLMDLTLEKTDLLQFLGVPNAQAAQFHFSEGPAIGGCFRSSRGVGAAVSTSDSGKSERRAIHRGENRSVARGHADRPVLVDDETGGGSDSAGGDGGRGATAEEDPSVLLVERCLALAEATVQRSAAAQIAAGARAMIVCEPAANTAYLSPRQLRAGSDILERFVLAPNRRLRSLLARHAVDLIFHDCGELTTDMVRQFAIQLRPAILSLGSSRNLWEDAGCCARRHGVVREPADKSLLLRCDDADRRGQETDTQNGPADGSVRPRAHSGLGVRCAACAGRRGNHPAQSGRDADLRMLGRAGYRATGRISKRKVTIP